MENPATEMYRDGAEHILWVTLLTEFAKMTELTSGILLPRFQVVAS